MKSGKNPSLDRYQSSSGKKIAKATLVIFTIGILSRVLGFFRDVIIAHQFGASATTDAFWVAFTVPAVFNNVIGTALATVVVPIFVEYASKNCEDEGWKVFSSIFNILFLSITVLTVAGIFISPVIANILGNSFDPVNKALTARLTAIMLPAISLMCFASLFCGLLNANNIFGPPVLGPAVMNVVIIGATFFAPFFGIYAVAVGVVVGSLLYAALQLPYLMNQGFCFQWQWKWRDETVRKILFLGAPVILISGISSVYIMIDWHFASGLTAGSIAALNYANRLVQLPQGLFVAAIVTAIYTTISKLAAEGDIAELISTFRKSIKVTLLFTVPSSFALFIIAKPIIVLVFQRGSFDAAATQLTVSALFFLNLGLVGMCVSFVLMRGFFALQDKRVPLVVFSCSIPFKYAISLVLVKIMHHAGLALATSLTFSLNMVIMSVFLQRRFKKFFDLQFFLFLGGLLLSSAVMAGSVYSVDSCLSEVLSQGSKWLAIRLSCDILVGILVFLVTGTLVKLDELKSILNLSVSMVKRLALNAR